MKYARVTPVVTLSALLLAGAALAESHDSCSHHSNVDGQACTHAGVHSGKHSGRHKRMDADAMREQMQKLGVSDAQKQELASLFGLYQPRFREIAERGKPDREALLLAAPDSENYDTLVGTVSQEAAAAAGEVVVLLAELQENAFALLTPEQQAKYQQQKLASKAELEAKLAARKASSDKDYSRTVRPGFGQTAGAP